MADIVFPGFPVGGIIGEELLPANYDLALYRGDVLPMTFTLSDVNGVAINLVGYTAKCQIKTVFDDPSPITATTTVTDAANGIISVVFSSAVTETITPGTYIWDFQVTDPSGNNRTYIAGDVTVYGEVTT